MKTTVQGLIFSCGAFFLLPVTAVYLYGLFFFMAMIFVGTDALSDKLLWAAGILTPGFALYSVWRLLFSVDLLRDAGAKKPPVYLWAGIAIGALLSMYICAALSNIWASLIFGLPLIVAIGLVITYIHASDGNRKTALPMDKGMTT